MGAVRADLPTRDCPDRSGSGPAARGRSGFVAASSDGGKVEFRLDSWQAFELSITGDLSTEEIAAELGKSVGAIYTARSRIMFRLREVIAELGEQDQ